MPLLDQDRVFTYTGNGIAISFVYGCKIFDSADLKVKVDEVLQVINTDYTLTGVGAAGGGTVDFLSAPADQADIEIYTDLEYKRDTDYVYGGDFKADAVDNDFDRIMMLIQQLRRETRRAIKAPMSETDDKILSEVAADRADKLLGFGSSGELVVQAITDLSTVLSTVGYGLELSGNDLHLAPPVKVVNTFPYTITASDHIILVDGTGTINFPQQSAVSSATIAKEYILINISGTATLAPYAGDTLPVTSLTGAGISYIGNGGTAWREPKAYNAANAVRAVDADNADLLQNYVADRWLSQITLANWTEQTNSSGDWFKGIAYSGSLYCVCGADSEIHTSPDGKTWTSRVSAETDDLNALTWGNSLFVNVANWGKLQTSPDGITWTSRTSNAGGDYLYGVTWGNALFVAVGEDERILTSPDGITWTSRNVDAIDLYDIAWNGTLFVAVGGTGRILTSPDGITWTSRTSGTANGLRGIAWDGSQWCAVGESDTILTSPDGITWTSRTSGTSGKSFSAIAWDDFRFCAVATGTIIVSPDGITWEERYIPSSEFVNHIIWDGKRFVIIGGTYNSSGLIMTSLRITR